MLLNETEARAVIERHRIQAYEIPAYGLVVRDGMRDLLIFRKTDGVILVIDVTGRVPAHYSQRFEVPASWWQTAWTDFAGLVQSVSFQAAWLLPLALLAFAISAGMRAGR